MAVITGVIQKLGVVGTAEPVGRIWLQTDMTQSDTNPLTALNCASGPRFEIAKIGYDRGAFIEVDTGNTANVVQNIRVV